MKNLTQERLKELLHYDPETGVFIWIKTLSNRIGNGEVAGTVNNVGYRIISIDYSFYLASRLAWFYVEGYWPEYEIDHKDRIRHNDKWENLRHVSHQCNMRNCKIQRNNTSGITGVWWDEKCQKWRVRIMISGKHFHIGYFNSKINAAKARWKAEVKHGFPNCNTTSTAHLYIQSEL